MQRTYTIEELSSFLKRPIREIQKLAEKEILKGTKNRGQWKFALPDIVLWIEKEMTQSEVSQTIQLENVVTNEAEEQSDVVLHNLLDIGSIDVTFAAKTKPSVIREIVKLGTNVGKLWDPETMSNALREREEMASTALEEGVAIMHPRRPHPNIIAEDFIALAITPTPIPFGGTRKTTDVFFLLCCQTDVSYLRTLGKLARVLKKPGFLDTLRECTDSSSVLELIEQTERELT